MKDTLFVMALKQEAMGLLDPLGADVLYTGIGKVNAAYALTRELTIRRHEGRLPAQVVNLGTAGSRCFRTGELIACHQFVQRDMDVTPLGFAHGETPFETLPAMLETPVLFSDMTNGLCGSGDSFVTGELAMECQVLDMEAYALAKVCRVEMYPLPPSNISLTVPMPPPPNTGLSVCVMPPRLLLNLPNPALLHN